MKEGYNNGIYFRIKYDFLTHKYYLKNIDEGFGTYIKIDNSIIKEKSIICIGNSYLAFSYDLRFNNQNNNKTKNYLLLKIFNENKKYEPIILTKENNYYSVGRTKNADIFIDDNFLSKINCIIYFENGIWKIKDGDQSGNKSTNGTWLYAFEDNEIYDNMIFNQINIIFIVNFLKIICFSNIFLQ